RLQSVSQSLDQHRLKHPVNDRERSRSGCGHLAIDDIEHAAQPRGGVVGIDIVNEWSAHLVDQQINLVRSKVETPRQQFASLFLVTLGADDSPLLISSSLILSKVANRHAVGCITEQRERVRTRYEDEITGY